MINKIWVVLGRALTLIDLVTNRAKSKYKSEYNKKRLKSLGSGVRFNGVSIISGHENITIGNNVHIGGHAFIRAEGGLDIMDNTHISRNLLLYTHSHDYEANYLPYGSSFRHRPVKIGKNVWIGMNVTILPGTEIGDGAIIGAGAVVAGKVEPLGIYGACVASKISWRNEEHYKTLEENQKYGAADGVPL